MRGRAFLDLAREIVVGGTERHWRGAVGRAYYAVMLEARDSLKNWGFTPSPRDNVHHFVRTRFASSADHDAKYIGRMLDRLGRLRNRADYDLGAWIAFTTAKGADDAI